MTLLMISAMPNYFMIIFFCEILSSKIFLCALPLCPRGHSYSECSVDVAHISKHTGDQWVVVADLGQLQQARADLLSAKL